MSKKKRGLPGNSIQEAADYTNELAREARTLRQLTRWIAEMSAHDVFIDALRFVIKDDEGCDVLLVLSATMDEGPFVAFFSGTSVLDCVTNLTRKAQSGQIRWKADEFRRPAGGATE
jgi:hypothetical protein